LSSPYYDMYDMICQDVCIRQAFDGSQDERRYDK